MGAKELMAYAVAGKLRKGTEFRIACCEVFAENNITDFDTQAHLMQEFGVILGNISAERTRQRGMRLFKKPPKARKIKSQPVPEMTAKPITKDKQQMFAGITDFVRSMRHMRALMGGGYRPSPHRWRPKRP